MSVSGDIGHDLDLASNFAEQIAEFFGIAKSEARDRLEAELREPGGLVAEAWRHANPNANDEIIRFYQETPSYVYDLAADHCKIIRQPVSTAIIDRIDRRGLKQNVLVYGDGIGDDSIAIARRGHTVTYFDLPGITSSFARFRFEKEKLGHNISVLSDEAAIPSDRYDAAVCIEVLEHVPDPPAVMRVLHRALSCGGVALITESFESIGPEFPSHLPQNFRYAGKTHRLMESLGFANTYYNIDPINRPMEFTKTRPDLKGELLRLRWRLYRAIDTRRRRLLARALQPR